jgi:hypothetical protein
MEARLSHLSIQIQNTYTQKTLLYLAGKRYQFGFWIQKDSLPKYEYLKTKVNPHLPVRPSLSNQKQFGDERIILQDHNYT